MGMGPSPYGQFAPMKMNYNNNNVRIPVGFESIIN